MLSRVRATVTTCGFIISIILIYYLILSNHAVLSELNEENRFLYAFISTSIMILLGALMSITWNFLDKIFSSESISLGKK